MRSSFAAVVIWCAALGSAFSAAWCAPPVFDDLLADAWAQEDALWQAAHPGGAPFSLEHLHDEAARADALSVRLRQAGADTARLDEAVARLGALLHQLNAQPPENDAARKAAYAALRRIKRDIAFSNPLLDMDRILFVERHHPKGVYHMCDQFYGFNAVAGGGVFVLENPFGFTPRVVNLLEGSIVETGRLAGAPLTPGAFLSPELSFDGATVYFAYSQAVGADLEWSERASWHLFKANADGSGLVQLTDDSTDDFDPCELPDGRIVFISERRGGYLRCGRHCPVYTMFSMNADGSDIRNVSFHETHEWQPSVNNDGMLVYTRWDYVDRDTNVAHHLWTCFPDGCDPRTFHGNYPEKRESRPWMEMDIRAVPGSHKYVAVTGAHHGNAFGALVLIDPRVEDDNAAAQLERITPEVPFPEATRDTFPIETLMIYGTPWPLSESDFLCAYAPDAKHHGLFWVDRFGNRELLYRDPAIPCISPIPMRPRPRPPVLPSPAAPDRAATVAVMNVYNSDFAWPGNTRIAALRIVQVLPKTTAPPNEPRIGVADQTNARAVLGTVPVEEDGSVYFEAPAGKELYFQALDENGLAVQSMRSGTYLQPGEQRTCQGCHEKKNASTPATAAIQPLALRRAPSSIAPEPDGSNPFNYVRLVQPVLDAHCVQCHTEKEALDLRNVVEGPNGWTRSYANLAKDYGFYFNVRNGSINDGVHGGSRTIPGAFGAKAAKLLAYLDAGHYGVELTPEERRRVTLWLDANSEFFGSYENTALQAKGEVVSPTLD